MKILQFLTSSDRYKHLIGGAVIGLLADSAYCAALAGTAAAGSLEFKDRAHGGQWDWLDFLFTLLGTALGYLIHFLIF